jgi:hypothetical protein
MISSRDDKTPMELFIAGGLGWQTGLRRQLENAMFVKQGR